MFLRRAAALLLAFAPHQLVDGESHRSAMPTSVLNAKAIERLCPDIVDKADASEATKNM